MLTVGPDAPVAEVIDVVLVTASQVVVVVAEALTLPAVVSKGLPEGTQPRKVAMTA